MPATHPLPNPAADDVAAPTGAGEPRARTFDITVVLCTYNRAALLADALRSLAEQQTGGRFSYEVLVVDNGSTDDTRDVVAAVARRHAETVIRCVHETRPGLSAARNRGIAEARGEWIAFFDDDERAVPTWLEALRALAREKQCRVVGGAVRLFVDGDPDGTLSPHLERLLAPGGRGRNVIRFTPANALNGGNQMVHHTVFDEIGSYDEQWTEGGEDTDWFGRLWRAGIAAWYTPAAAVRHLVPAYRLAPGYLQWLSARQGWSTARHDHDRRGAAATTARAVLRVGRAMLLHAPAWLSARLAGSAERALYRRCQLGRAAGYVRFLLWKRAPSLFAQKAFQEWIEFRGERRQFTAPSAPPPAPSRSQGPTA